MRKKVWTKKSKKKLSNTMYEKWHSQETREKMVKSTSSWRNYPTKYVS